MTKKLTYLIPALAVLLIAGNIFGRAVDDSTGPDVPAGVSAIPAYCIAEHNVGKIAMSVSNNGTIGTGISQAGQMDCFTGEQVHSFEYPKGSFTTYLFSGTVWIGAVVGQDTLVSTGADGWSTSANEFHPEELPLGAMEYRSTLDPDRPEFEGAVSEQDYVAVYYDTCTNCPGITYDEMDGRPHIPLGLEITQNSYAWSYPHAEDFVLFDYGIKNIGPESLHEVYLGFYIDADVYPVNVDGSVGAQDDITGFLSSTEHPTMPAGCLDSMDLNLAWAADNDGGISYPYELTPHVTGLLMLRSPSESLKVSYNWWVSNGNPSLDFGPQTRDGRRDFGTGGLGTPSGDRNKYFVLSNGEIDYDQVRTATIGSLDPIWLPPPEPEAGIWCTGLDTRYLLSFGPFDIEPGQQLPLSFAYVAGEDFHSDPNNLNNLPEDPDAYYENVDFSDLITNAVWAGWVFDNPGFDSDGDGDSGRAVVWEGDTIWYGGDGVPDYRAAAAPDAPVIRVEPTFGGLCVRWNGHGSETCLDPFSQTADFEGYHVFLSQEATPVNFVQLAEYDVEDYYKFFWNPGLSDWDIAGERFLVDDLVCTYAAGGCGDPSWHPLDFPRENPYFMPGFPDSVFYFEPILANASRFGHETPVVKVYPEAPRPPYSSPEDVPPDSASVYLTEDSLFKFYEYEYVIENLIPEDTYWVSVTAFDFGSFAVELPSAQESSVGPNAIQETPFPDETNCCLGDVGSIALVPDCSAPDQQVDITDIQFLIDHMFNTLARLCCEEEADIDQSGTVDIVDLQLLIDHQYLSLAPLPPCP